MGFRSVFIAVVLATALIVAAFLLNARRPRPVTGQPTAEFALATGKCAECHRNMQYSIVHEYEMSTHAARGVNCLDCHHPEAGQQAEAHHGFEINTAVTAANCRTCHETIYQQFLRSRHAAPAWAAIAGGQAFTSDQVAFSERFQPGGTRRPANPITRALGQLATQTGCAGCHSIGRPNDDGTIGSCTACHTRHTSSLEVARLPSTCGQCHMGPDHSQLEIYTESKHGVMFEAQRALLNLAAPAGELTTRDMFVPTCATCHMSGLNGMAVTHDPSDRLSYFLFAEISARRPEADRAEEAMKDVCRNCHTDKVIDRVYRDAAAVVASTNEKVATARNIIEGLRRDGLISKTPFSRPIDFTYFDLWHYDGRTAKHGAFMGGSDFVQWHGNYPILKHTIELRAEADALRREHGR
ncbi:MAG: multiheme c-type cytochrome [Gemmatimonadales bacterium]